MSPGNNIKNEEPFRTCPTCDRIHEALSKMCDMRHLALEQSIELAISNALKDFPKPAELRGVLLQRATDRAWSYLGKLVVAGAAIWVALQTILNAIHAVR